MTGTISTILTQRRKERKERKGVQIERFCGLASLREISGKKANGVSSERQASESQRLQRARYFPAARSRGSSIGSQSSILFPSGSMIQPNLPYSNSSTSPTTVTPSLRNSSRSALRFSTR
ncbi:MAG: hypothetical protein HW389_3644 [Bacteroidetes bacterium]|nr:hypothetical protein [Bacteroidota bacterium]